MGERAVWQAAGCQKNGLQSAAAPAAARRTHAAPTDRCCLRCCHNIRSKRCTCCLHEFAPSKQAQLLTAPLPRAPMWDGKGDLGPAKIGGKDRETFPRNNKQALSCMEKMLRALLAHVSGLHAGSVPPRACMQCIHAHAHSMRMCTQHALLARTHSHDVCNACCCAGGAACPINGVRSDDRTAWARHQLRQALTRRCVP